MLVLISHDSLAFWQAAHGSAGDAIILVAVALWSLYTVLGRRAMAFYNTPPLYGALLARLFLGEQIGPAHLVGGALIVAGGTWAARAHAKPAAQAGRSVG